MDASQWPQGMGLQVKPMTLGDQFASSTNSDAAAAAISTTAKLQAAEREMRERQRPRPSKEQALNCPRCNSTNTKFCYYNNYSLTQPRYFCKTCRRYWTEGGSLRNVPVGGGSRKNKNKTTAAAAASASAVAVTAASTSSKAPKLFHEGQDLNLAFHKQSHLPEFNPIGQASSSCNSYNLSAMDLLKSTTAAVPMPLPDYTSAGFGGLMQEFMRPPTLSFPLDTSGFGSLQLLPGVNVQESSDHAAGNSKLMFPLQELKGATEPSKNIEFEQNKGQGGDPVPPGYWNSMLMGGGGGGGGGGSW